MDTEFKGNRRPAADAARDLRKNLRRDPVTYLKLLSKYKLEVLNNIQVVLEWLFSADSVNILQ